MACKATIVEGKRKGQPCEFPPSENGYCGRHQRHYEYEQLVKEAGGDYKNALALLEPPSDDAKSADAINAELEESDNPF